MPALIEPSERRTISPRAQSECRYYSDFELDTRPHFRYIMRILPTKGRRPGDIGRWGRSGSRGQGLVTSVPGRLGHHPAGTMTGA